MESLVLLFFGLSFNLFITGVGGQTTKLPGVDVLYTFPLPNQISTTPSIGSCSSTRCGDCGFCLQNSSCYCFDGCKYDNLKNQCYDIDECINSPCTRGGTCVNLPGSYNCICVSGFAGMNCQLNLTDDTLKPEVSYMPRLRGIQAGGGVLEVNGCNFEFFPPIQITFSLEHESIILYGGISQNDLSSSDKFFLITPMTNQIHKGKDFTITAEFSGGFILEVTNKFIFTDNPRLDDTTPKHPIITANGGAILTLIGDNLDVPSRTIILADLNVSNYSDIIFIGRGNSVCEPFNETICFCPMPNFEIPSNSSSWLNSTEDLNKTMNITVVQDAFDGNDKFIKPSFKVPRILFVEDVEYYDQDHGESIKIEADGVDTLSSSLADYKVDIGGSTCSMTSLTTNLLECMPPYESPQRLDNNNVECHIEGLAVMVNAFSTTQFSKCVSYYSSRRLMIIGFCVAAAIVLVIIIILVVVMIKKLTCPVISASSYKSRIVNPSKAHGTLTSGIVNHRVVQSLYGIDSFAAMELGNVTSQGTTDTLRMVNNRISEIDEDPIIGDNNNDDNDDDINDDDDNDDNNDDDNYAISINNGNYLTPINSGINE